METGGRQTAWHGVAVVSLLAVFAVAVHGYHPFAEDGGLYVAGIRKLLDPALYPAWTEFVTEHLRFSLFAPAVAGVVRATHLSLEFVLLALYLASLWATLFAGWMLISRTTEDLRARVGAVSLLACWLTLPIAGTSLMLMDPYVTARSFSTPLVLMALAWALDAVSPGGTHRARSAALCGLTIGVAAALHPLMAGYGLAAVAVLCCLRMESRRARRWGQIALMVFALASAALLQWNAPAESPAYLRVALTRYYWFPFVWKWYEQLGLLAPLLILAWLRRIRVSPTWKDLAGTGLQLGLIAVAVAVFFSHEQYATHLVARLQPLRCFQIVYELMILLLGAWLGEHVLKAHFWRWGMVLAALGGVMLFVQRSTFPNSAHIEWPWVQASNPWEQAFVWARDHTPKDALFALDAHYITMGRHEDAQCFRSIAQRSALADYSKDGGEASITPSLTDAWVEGQTAQTGLEDETDSERIAKLRPLGAGWVVLETRSKTSWNCPYTNATVKVCRLP
jgi:hypothetical protein